MNHFLNFGGIFFKTEKIIFFEKCLLVPSTTSTTSSFATAEYQGNFCLDNDTEDGQYKQVNILKFKLLF